MIRPPTPLEALQLGWSIIPVNAWKRPLIKWKHLQERQPTPEEIEAWEYLPHQMAWAMITGAISHQISLDFDGEEGTALMRKWGLKPFRQTPSNGFHTATKHPGFPIKTLSSKNQTELNQRWPGLDIRGDGGYVVFSGQVFIKGSNPSRLGFYRWLRDPVEPPDPFDRLPSELREFLQRTKSEETKMENERTNDNYQPRNGNLIYRPASSNLLVHMAVGKIMDGRHRNDAGFWLATQLRDNRYPKTHALGIDFSGRCPKTNAQGENDLYTQREWRRTVESAYSQKAGDPWGAPNKTK